MLIIVLKNKVKYQCNIRGLFYVKQALQGGVYSK